MEEKKIKSIFETLSKGSFISENSKNGNELYCVIKKSQEDYFKYFFWLGFELTEGNGYFYFTRSERKQDLVDKLKAFEEWIRILDFLKLYDSSIRPGSQISKLNICARLDTEIELQERAKSIANSISKNYDGTVDHIFDKMVKIGFAEPVDDLEGRYNITSAYNYLEEMVNLITIKDNG